jgi:hypothetical protein
MKQKQSEDYRLSKAIILVIMTVRLAHFDARNRNFALAAKLICCTRRSHTHASLVFIVLSIPDEVRVCGCARVFRSIRILYRYSEALPPLLQKPTFEGTVAMALASSTRVCRLLYVYLSLAGIRRSPLHPPIHPLPPTTCPLAAKPMDTDSRPHFIGRALLHQRAESIGHCIDISMLT